MIFRISSFRDLYLTAPESLPEVTQLTAGRSAITLLFFVAMENALYQYAQHREAIHLALGLNAQSSISIKVLTNLSLAVAAQPVHILVAGIAIILLLNFTSFIQYA